MNAADEIFGLITDLQRVRVKIRKMDKGKKLSQVFPNTLEDVYQKLYEASSNLADFWCGFETRECEDI